MKQWRSGIGRLIVIGLSLIVGAPGEPPRVESHRTESTRQANPIRVISPNGGERIIAGSVFTIRWEITENLPIAWQQILLSTDGGESFSPITPPALGASVRSYDWSVPANLETKRGRIRILAPTPFAIINDESDGDFTIFIPNVPSRQENITLGGVRRQNRFTIEGDEHRVSGELAGSLDVRFSTGDDPTQLSVELMALSWHGASVTVKGHSTGRLLLAKEHTTFAGGRYDLETGEFRIPLSIQLTFSALTDQGEGWVIDQSDVRLTPRPVIFSAILTGRRNPRLKTASGTLEGVIEPNAPLLGGMSFTANWSGKITEGDSSSPLVFCSDFCVDVKVIADNAAGDGAVIGGDDVERLLMRVNDIWAQCGIRFALEEANADPPRQRLTFIPATAEVIDEGGRSLTDGDLRRITDRGTGLTDEERALMSLSANDDCLDIYLVGHLVTPEGESSSHNALTIGGGLQRTAIIMAVSGATVDVLATRLAHQLGHALGLTHDALPAENLMAAGPAYGSALNTSQCITASSLNALAERLPCGDRTFQPEGVDVMITGLDPDVVVRGQSTTISITGRGLAGAEAIQFPPRSGLRAEILHSTDHQIEAHLSATLDAPTGRLRFSVRTPHGVARSGVIRLLVR